MTAEKRIQVFAKYFGQKMGYMEKSPASLKEVLKEVTINRNNLGLLDYNSKYKLILRELSEITDEEAVTVAKLMAGIIGERKFDINRKEEEIILVPLYPELDAKGQSYRKQELVIRFNGEIFDRILPISNQHLITQYLFERGFSLPIWELDGRTPIEEGIGMKKYQPT
jgi:hypothetical protein